MVTYLQAKVRPGLALRGHHLCFKQQQPRINTLCGFHVERKNKRIWANVAHLNKRERTQINALEQEGINAVIDIEDVTDKLL